MEAREHERRVRIVVFDVNPNSGAVREDTYTLDVAPTWARIHLRHPVAPGTPLVVYNLESGRQAEFVVDSIPAAREVTIRPTDRAADIWQLDAERGSPREAPEAPPADHISHAEREWQKMETALGTGAEARAAQEAAAAARYLEAEAEVSRATDHARLLGAQVAEQTETALDAHRKAIETALETTQALKHEVEEMADRANLARERAYGLTRQATEACARASAAAGGLESLQAEKKDADRKLAEARRHLKSAEEALAAARVDLARTAREARVRAEAAARAVEPIPKAVPQPEKPVEPIVARAAPVGPPPSAPPTAAAAAATAGASALPLSETTRFLAGFTGPVSWEDRRTTRRVRVRTRARIRGTGWMEIVQPLNISRRGIGFESGFAYGMSSRIWVALHYQEDSHDLLETPSRIVRVLPRANGLTYYGVRFEG